MLWTLKSDPIKYQPVVFHKDSTDFHSLQGCVAGPSGSKSISEVKERVIGVV